jgi:RIO-like serine/threonine protein kinase
VERLPGGRQGFLRRAARFRLFVAPFLISREIAALKRLDGLACVPAFYARLDRLAFALEFIEGTPLDTFARGELAPEVFPRVEAAIASVHARGVSHADLKRRSNILLRPDGEIAIVDFAAAIVGRRRGRFFSNWLQREVAHVDRKSVPRLKNFVAPELMSEDDRQKLDNPTSLERWARRLLNR